MANQLYIKNYGQHKLVDRLFGWVLNSVLGNF